MGEADCNKNNDLGISRLQAWTNLGVLEREGGDLDAAQAALAAALAHAPTHPVVLANLASLHVLIGNQANPENPASSGGAAGPVAARAAYERALAYDPASTDALYNLGVLAAADRAWERALFYYQTCVRLAPRHSLAWNNLGVAYQNVDNVAAAMACYEAAVAARPDFALALNNLGVLLTTQGHSARGRRHLRAAVAADGSYAEAHNNLGVLLRDMGLVREVRRLCTDLCTTLAVHKAARGRQARRNASKQTRRALLAGDRGVRALHAPGAWQRQRRAEPAACAQLHPRRRECARVPRARRVGRGDGGGGAAAARDSAVGVAPCARRAIASWLRLARPASALRVVLCRSAVATAQPGERRGACSRHRAFAMRSTQ